MDMFLLGHFSPNVHQKEFMHNKQLVSFIGGQLTSHYQIQLKMLKTMAFMM